MKLWTFSRAIPHATPDTVTVPPLPAADATTAHAPPPHRSYLRSVLSTNRPPCTNTSTDDVSVITLTGTMVDVPWASCVSNG